VLVLGVSTMSVLMGKYVGSLGKCLQCNLPLEGRNKVSQIVVIQIERLSEGGRFTFGSDNHHPIFSTSYREVLTGITRRLC
jgi:hypothetical protein